jgi:site-specific recombinase XerD
MAAVCCNANGQFSIQWRRGKDRLTIYLGKVPKKYAEEFGRRVELLEQAKQYAQPTDPLTLLWLAGLGLELKAKLADRGLIDTPGSSSLAGLCQYCIAQADVEPSSLQKYRDTEANLLAFFGDRPLHLISPGDADEFSRWLGKCGKRPGGGPLQPPTVSKRLQQARQFFASAVRKRWILENPFDGVSVAATVLTDRKYYVTRELAQTLMDAANPEMRLMIALARFGGLRIPSELWPLELTWINQETSLLQVLSPKNKRHVHKKWRFVPIFPEIRGLLADAFDAAPEGSTLLFPNQGITATALRNRLERLCKHCGIVPWPKLWQNMRSTRETELIDAGYPIHVVCEWLNNSPVVAIKHYCQVAKDHVSRAIAAPPDSEMTEKPPAAADVSVKFTVTRANHS